VALADLDGALFSVAGTAPDDVWTVGADQGGGRGPTALHWDGATWTAHDTRLDGGDLLWVHVFDGGPVLAAGSHGRILRRADAGAFEPMATPSQRTVWGVWGASPEALWAVGGLATDAAGFVWRYQDGSWSEVALDPAVTPAPAAWFKVWGSAADDVWFCGTDGALMHWDGAAFAAVDAGTKRTLLTVHGRADGSLVTAVGGQFSATLVASRAGAPWQDVTPPGDPPLQTFGVFHRGETAYAVGMQSVILRHDGAAWQVVDPALDLYEDLHGVWIDPAGGVWAAGGQVIAPPFRSGTLLHYGTSPPASSLWR
jgi:hypothetical protein